jgi:signal transduction histidine kinase
MRSARAEPNVGRVIRIPPRSDLALAAAIGAVSMQSAFAGSELKSPAWAAILLTQLTALPVAFRRVRPVAAFAVALAAAVAGFLAFDGFLVLGPLVALYAVARHADRASSLGAAAAGVTASLLPAAATGQDNPLFATVATVSFGAVWALGRRAGAREAEVEAARASAARAAQEERARIARELHDVISHNVSVMVVQAAAGRDVFSASPERAREALGAIERAGREALGELRRLLSLVDPPDAEAAGAVPAPQPSLERLDALVDGMRAAGLDVRVDLDGELGVLPPGIDLSAYRIVQEALTNVLKHSSASATGVQLRRTGTHLELDIVDDGEGSEAAVAGGRGLIGMRERVQLLGGELAVGPRPEGGFAVRASIPIGGRG